MEPLIKELSNTQLPDEVQKGVQSFANSLHEILGDNLISIVLYGSVARGDYNAGESDVNLLIVLENIDLSTLNSLAEPVSTSRRNDLSPFFMTDSGLSSSTKVFPIKFLSMKEHYRVLFGRDVFDSLEVSRQNLRLRCQQEAQNQLFRLRRYFFQRNGAGLREKIVRDIGSLLDVLRMAISLKKSSIPTREEGLQLSHEILNIDPEFLRKVQALKFDNTFLPRDEEETLFNQYLETAGKIVEFTDSLDDES